MGEMIHPKTMLSSLNQLTTDGPPTMRPKPIIAPTMECVVETGRLLTVARNTHKEPARSAESNPKRINFGSVRAAGSIIPLRIVWVT